MMCKECGFKIRGKKHILGYNHTNKKRTLNVPKIRIIDNKPVKRVN